MFNKQLKQNIKKVDTMIEVLMDELIDAKGDDADTIQKKIDDLTEIRGKLSDDMVNESYLKEVMAGALSLASIVLVLKHEKADIITSKAFSMATKLFRG